ncbi:MAG: ACT domain-containing protein [Bacillota bacterium]
MRAVLTVVGEDKKGIIGRVSGALSDFKVNIEEISQTVLQNYFTMMMIVDLVECELSFAELQVEMKKIGEGFGVAIHVMHEDIFKAMHSV